MVHKWMAFIEKLLVALEVDYDSAQTSLTMLSGSNLGVTTLRWFYLNTIFRTKLCK